MFSFEVGNAAPNFISVFGPEQNISFSTSFEDIPNMTTQYVGFQTVSSLI